MALIPSIRVFSTAEALADGAADWIAGQARRKIDSTGKFSLALSGGSTPKLLFRVLAAEPYYSHIDWPNVEIFFSDERCVPPDDPQSNFGMAKENLLSKLPLRPENVYRMRGEIEPEAAAVEYGKTLKAKFAEGGLDAVLLGMGPDGHTASLFPETKGLAEMSHRCVANYVPKMSTWRLTMTAPFINRAGCVAVLVAGEEKSKIVKEVLEQPVDAGRYPIQLIQPASGQLIWFMDSAAAGM